MEIERVDPNKKEPISHPDWKKNCYFAIEYMKTFPQDAKWNPETEQEVSYTIEIERTFINGESMPWLFWLIIKSKKYPYDAARPVKFHQGHEKFIEEVKSVFPFKSLINKITTG